MFVGQERLRARLGIQGAHGSIVEIAGVSYLVHTDKRTGPVRRKPIFKFRKEQNFVIACLCPLKKEKIRQIHRQFHLVVVQKCQRNVQKK